MAVDLDEAFRRAAAHFYSDNNSFAAMEKQQGKPIKYNKPHFDDYEKHLRKKMKKSAMSKEQENTNEDKTDIMGEENGDS